MGVITTWWQVVLVVLTIGVLTLAFPLVVELATHLGICWSERRKRLHCVHEWKVLDKHVEPSPLDKSHDITYQGPSGMTDRMTRGTYICILSCFKCGSIDKTKEAV